MFIVAITNTAKSNRRSVVMLTRHLQPQTLHHRSCITQPASDALTTTMPLDVLQRKCAKVFLFINVGNSGHPRAYDEFGMIFEEVYLHNGTRNENKLLHSSRNKFLVRFRVKKDSSASSSYRVLILLLGQHKILGFCQDMKYGTGSVASAFSKRCIFVRPHIYIQ